MLEDEINSKARKQIKKRIKMNNIRRIGAQPGQIQISEQDTMEKACECGGVLFDTAHRMRVLPAVSPKNPSGRDMLLKVEVYLCRACGAELK